MKPRYTGAAAKTALAPLYLQLAELCLADLVGIVGRDDHPHREDRPQRRGEDDRLAHRLEGLAAIRGVFGDDRAALARQPQRDRQLLDVILAPDQTGGGMVSGGPPLVLKPMSRM